MNNYQLSIKKYPSYKDSTIEWLGDVPEHWKVRRLKEVIVSPLSYGANEMASDSNPEHPRFIRITDFSENEELKDETFKSLSPNIAQKYLLKEGDILFARSGATIGKTFHFKNYKGKACYAGYLIKARPNPNIISSNFLSYYTKSSLYDTWKSQVFIKATIENISAEKYSFFLFIPLPPLAEQKSIATYLDTKTAQIDRKIDLLTQKAKSYADLKRSIINETVTRGLERSVAMKDSEIDAIGEVPEHWKAVRLKNIFTYTKGYAFKSDDFIDFGTPVVKATDIKQYRILEPTSFIDSSILESYKNVLLKNNDIIISTVGSQPNVVDSAVGQLARIDEKTVGSLLNQNTLILRVKTKMLSNEFLYYILISKFFRQHLDLIARGTANQSSIKVSETLEYFLFLPTFDEQKSIATYLDTKTAQIDQIIQNINTQIEKLKELRKTLINDVVTGKIKVTEPQ
jgi:type I restriction enzyme S subunit